MTGPQKQQNGVRLGVRIEFYDHIGPAPDYTPDGYIGSALADEALSGAAAPREGELVALASLDGGSGHGHKLRPTTAGPFLRVARVEHYPAALAVDGQMPAWWTTEWSDPSVTLVFRVERPTEMNPAGETLASSLAARGWWVDPLLLIDPTPREP